MKVGNQRQDYSHPGNRDEMDPTLPEFQASIEGPESDWDLFELALQLCWIGDPRASLEGTRRQIALFCDAAQAVGPSQSDDYGKLDAVNTALYEQGGLKGDDEDYHNPDNSFINRVLERKRGIPVTLCLIHRKVASSLGLELACVGLPGHFLLKYERPVTALFIDAYNSGIILLEDGCRKKLDELFGGKIPFTPDLLRNATPREVILRVLANLKRIYRDSGDTLRLFRVLNRRIPLQADPLAEILERGVLQLSMDLYRGALSDFEFFVAHTPDERMRVMIAEQLERLRLLANGN